MPGIKWICKTWVRLLVGMFICNCGAPSSFFVAEVIDTPPVLSSGCVEVDAGQCVLGQNTPQQRIWIDTHVDTRLMLHVNGDAVPFQRHAVDGGLQLQFSLPANARDLVLNGVNPKWRQPWRRVIRQHDEPPWLNEIREQWKQAKDRNDREYLAHRLESLCDESQGWNRLRGLDLLRRCIYELHDLKRASELNRQTIALAKRLGASKTEAAALLAEAHIQILRRSELERGEDLIEQLFSLGNLDPSALIRAHYSSALLERSRGNLVGSFVHLRDARHLSERMGEYPILADVIELEAMTLGELGRGEEANELAHQVLTLFSETEITCKRKVQIARNFGWTQLLMGSLGLPHSPSKSYFLEVLRLQKQCPSDWEQANSIVNLALAALQDEQPERALEWLTELEWAIPKNLQEWVEEVRVQAALDIGSPRLVDSLMYRPSNATNGEQRWRSLVRQARVAQRFGFFEVAEEGFRKAEEVLDHSLRATGLGSGAELYLAGRTASIKGLVETLLDVGRVKDALCAARLARARGLLVLDRVTRLAVSSEEDRDLWNQILRKSRSMRREVSRRKANLWKLSVEDSQREQEKMAEQLADSEELFDHAMRTMGLSGAAKYCHELRTSQPGEVIVYLFPMLDDWAVFTIKGSDLSVHRVEREELFSPKASWLNSIDGLDHAQQVVVVPSGQSWGIRVHALAWRDGILLDHAAVRYSLDLPPSASDFFTPSDDHKSSLVVADPSNNLPWAVREADSVKKTLSRQGGRVEAKLGMHASREEVLRRIPQVDLFHYAGHGAHRGQGGWNSELMMYDGKSIDIRDILSLPSIPAGVVLTGCETGTANLETLQGGMNLSRAFLLAGSTWVIASDQRIDDESAHDFARIFYEHYAQSKHSASAMRAALLAMRDQDSFGVWHNLRMISR